MTRLEIGLDSNRPDLMNDTRTDAARRQLQAQESGRLDSWKKIAAHFNRDVTTVQRWERREGMPVHRHLHDTKGSVYAFGSELDAWWKGRRDKLPDSGDRASESSSNAPPEQSPAERSLPGSPEPTPTPEAELAAMPREALLALHAQLRKQLLPNGA